MREEMLPLVLTLALLIAALSVLSRRAQLPAPLVMLTAGVLLSFFLPPLTLDPNLVLLLLLPPLLYSSGVGMSWPGFKSNLRPILFLAIGCVLFTASAVAAVAHYLFGLSWAAGFVLGAIVSPPDAVAPMAIARRLGLPKRVAWIIEGESLVNDATALVVLSIALGAVATGQFSFGDAALRFATISVGELAYGLFVGWVTLWVRFKVAEPQTELLIALATPFMAFWLPHNLGGSGVIACVTTGLYVSWNGRILIPPNTRLQGYFIWGLVVWTIEALVFLLTGLQASQFWDSLSSSSWPRLLLSGAVVSITVVVIRFVWVFPATYLPRFGHSIAERDPPPRWQIPFLISFAGLRGVVSLAAALSIPLMIGDRGFPDRDLILFVTFCVILTTLLGLGTTLPWVIVRLGLAKHGRAERDIDKTGEQTARIAGVNAALAALDTAEAKRIPEGVVRSLRKAQETRLANLTTTADATNRANPVADASALELLLLDAERTAISDAYLAENLSDEARRRIERELDLEQARIEHHLESATGEDVEAPKLETTDQPKAVASH